MIEITNNGEIELEAISLMGASPKRGDDSKIGMFGSGNKYALATLLRHEIPVRIFQGKKEIKLTTKPVTFRGAQFNKLVINDRETDLTIEMGPKWEPWFALREFVSNAIDEGGFEFAKVSGPKPEEGKTKIYIHETPVMRKIMANLNAYFCFDEKPLYTVETGKLGTISVLSRIPDAGFIMYRKGIRIIPENKNLGLFRYDFSDIEINESRIYNSDWAYRIRMAAFYTMCNDIDILKQYIKIAVNSSYKDHDIYFDYSSEKLSPAWHTLLSGKKVIAATVMSFLSLPAEDKQDLIVLPDSLVDKIEAQIEDVEIIGNRRKTYFESDMSQALTMAVIAAKNLFEKKGIYINVPVRGAIFKGVNTYACYDEQEKTIYLSEKILENPETAPKLPRILLEEFIHSLGYRHGTREFDYFLVEIIFDFIIQGFTTRLTGSKGPELCDMHRSMLEQTGQQVQGRHMKFP